MRLTVPGKGQMKKVPLVGFSKKHPLLEGAIKLGTARGIPKAKNSKKDVETPKAKAKLFVKSTKAATKQRELTLR